MRGWLRHDSTQPLDSLDCRHLAGFVRHAFVLAFHHLRASTPFTDAIQQTLCCGGDTDTNAGKLRWLLLFCYAAVPVSKRLGWHLPQKRAQGSTSRPGVHCHSHLLSQQVTAAPPLLAHLPVAAIVGGMMGALHGASAIPSWMSTPVLEFEGREDQGGGTPRPRELRVGQLPALAKELFELAGS